MTTKLTFLTHIPVQTHVHTQRVDVSVDSTERCSGWPKARRLLPHSRSNTKISNLFQLGPMEGFILKGDAGGQTGK